MSEYRVQRNSPNIPKGKDAQDDDILEHYLNFGMKDTTKRLSVSQERVREVVIAFKKDIEDYNICHCIENGIMTPIWIHGCTCDGNLKGRIKPPHIQR
jgi:hypothetical protein